MQNLVKRLKQQGLTKWAIAKQIGVSWQTIHMWEKETFKPTIAHQTQLEELLEIAPKT